jgi:hypothetical protein
MIHEAARRAARSAKIFKRFPRINYSVNNHRYYMYESAVRNRNPESINSTCVITGSGT